MADGTIFDQTQETELTAAHRFLVQDTSAATASQSATFALAGGLEVSNETVTTGDVTGVVGTLHVCTIAGLTANRNLTLPSAQIGERVGVYVVDGDATYELILKGAASQTINGGTAATEWSRVFIQGECVIFRCVAANTWIVEYDGRIPCQFNATLSASNTGLTAGGANVAFDFDAGEILTDVGDCGDATNNRFNLRRDGTYIITFQAFIDDVDANSVGVAYVFYDEGVTDQAVIRQSSYSPGNTLTLGLSASTIKELSVSTHVNLQAVTSNNTSTGTYDLVAVSSTSNTFAVTEVIV